MTDANFHIPQTAGEGRTVSRSTWWFVGITTLGLLLLLLGLTAWLLAPQTLNGPISLEIEPGMSVRDIAALADERGIVRSELVLYSILTAFYDPTNIHAGRYVFNGSMHAFAVADKIANHEVDEDLISLTIPEGTRATLIAQIAGAELERFNEETYLTLALPEEGKLFPETYYVPPTFPAADLYQLQVDTYADATAPLRAAIASSSLSESEVLTLASILEREANDETSMKMVSGILQNRLELGMPLQADATIEYELDTPLNELPPGGLAQQIRELESPYNTYKNTGLPPTPIGNPGIMAISAVLVPTDSEYLYYLTSDDGTFHYAKTLDAHNRNIERHLR